MQLQIGKWILRFLDYVSGTYICILTFLHESCGLPYMSYIPSESFITYVVIGSFCGCQLTMKLQVAIHMPCLSLKVYNYTTSCRQMSTCSWFFEITFVQEFNVCVCVCVCARVCMCVHACVASSKAINTYEMKLF